MRLLTLATCLSLLSAAALAQTIPTAPATAPAPTSYSQASFGCALMGGNALNIEVGMKSFAVRMSIWGDGLGQLRQNKNIDINGVSTSTDPGDAKLCMAASECRPAKARFELTSSTPVAGGVLEGRLSWYEPSVDRYVGLPVSTTITPAERRCR